MDVNKRTVLTRPLGDDYDEQRQSGMSKLWPQQLQIRSPAISRACLLAPVFPEHSYVAFGPELYLWLCFYTPRMTKFNRSASETLQGYLDVLLLRCSSFGANIHNPIRIRDSVLIWIDWSLSRCLTDSNQYWKLSIRFNSVVRRTTWLSRGLLEFLTYIQRTYFLWPYLHLVFANIPFLFGKLIDSTLVILLIINDPRVMQTFGWCIFVIYCPCSRLQINSNVALRINTPFSPSNLFISIRIVNSRMRRWQHSYDSATRTNLWCICVMSKEQDLFDKVELCVAKKSKWEIKCWRCGPSGCLVQKSIEDRLWVWFAATQLSAALAASAAANSITSSSRRVKTVIDSEYDQNPRSLRRGFNRYASSGCSEESQCNDFQWCFLPKDMRVRTWMPSPAPAVGALCVGLQGDLTTTWPKLERIRAVLYSMHK